MAVRRGDRQRRGEERGKKCWPQAPRKEQRQYTHKRGKQLRQREQRKKERQTNADDKHKQTPQRGKLLSPPTANNKKSKKERKREGLISCRMNTPSLSTLIVRLPPNTATTPSGKRERESNPTRRQRLPAARKKKEEKKKNRRPLPNVPFERKATSGEGSVLYCQGKQQEKKGRIRGRRSVLSVSLGDQPTRSVLLLLRGVSE